jgi:hypothetical protein
MSDDRRHHRVSRDVQVIVIPVPVAGSPAPLNQAKPAKYPHHQRQAWRPATRPPSKGRATVRLLDAIIENDAAARNLLRPLPPSAMLTR